MLNANTSLTQKTLAQAFLARSFNLSQLVQNVILMAVGLVLLALSAKVKIFLGPVPFTLQTLVVLLLAVAYGARLGAASVALYVFGGMITGLPVFASSFAVTGGYLFGFVVAAALVGALAERGWDRSFVRTFALMVLGNMIIYFFGLLYLMQAGALLMPALDGLAHLFGQHAHGLPALGLAAALKAGLLPFIVSDLLKIMVAVLLLPSAWSLMSNLKSK